MTWKGVLKTRGLIRKGSCFKVSNGWDINLWTDPWVPGPVSRMPQFLHPDGGGLRRVAELLEGDEGGWNINILNTVFSQEEAAWIQSIRRPRVPCKDKLIWLGTKDGSFSVKSCYELIQEEDENGPNGIWNLIWRADIHERVKLFLWRLVADVLPTKAQIGSSLGLHDTFCTMCGEGEETTYHLFKECPAAKAIAFASKWSFRLDSIRCCNVEELVTWCLKTGVVDRPRGMEASSFSVMAVSFLYSI